ncbi:hypothetical protein LTR36_001534 [Oleoguttula mirabilis]|uniref:Uncharacterized protein n=1 Tax=Oleoguttula mirabilis TaxID=1507867 RepID=A0AAV9JN57_9PEZI|nr:hypothetical protein LTR36_001534 [Oleoguttula mirabilis]
MPTAVITGCNSGIGYAFAQILIGEAWDVHACDHEVGPGLQALQARLHRLDVRFPESIHAFAAQLQGMPVDVLLNVAGIMAPPEKDNLETTTKDILTNTFETNTFGPLLLTQALLPNLLASQARPPRVCIVSSRVGSIGDNSTGGSYAYRASKAAVNSVGKSMAVDLEDKGIVVSLLHPGYVNSNMMLGMDNPEAVEPAEAAGKLWKVVQSKGMEETGSPPCQRCTRLKKDCIVTPPKSQKGRVAELEAKVEALTRLLEAQGLSTLSSKDGGDESSHTDETTPPEAVGTAPTAGAKKRRLEGSSNDRVESYGAETSEVSAAGGFTAISYGGTATLGLDQIVPVEMQARILHRYTTEVYPHFPILPLPAEHALENLRSSQPRLLQAIIYAMGWPILSVEIQEKVARLLMNHEIAMTAEPQTLELVQAIQMVCLWYRAPKHHKHLAVWQLIEASADIASQTMARRDEDSDRLGSYRAWLMCYLLSHVASVYLRESNANVWTAYHEECTNMLVYSAESPPGDILLAQYVRAEHLCEQIVSQLQLNDSEIVLDICSPAVKTKMQALRNGIIDWQASIPASLRIPSLLFWQHVATIHLHEYVLYTATNKQSFAAPYVVERLSVTDFPAPAVLQPEHVASLLALKTACHALLDLFSAFDSKTLLALPTLLYIPRAAYALYLLIKMYIACCAVGNTYGAVIGVAELRVDAYLEEAVDVAVRLTAVVNHGAPAAMRMGTVRTREWFENYKATMFNAEIELYAGDGPADDIQQQWLPFDARVTTGDDVLAWCDFPLMPGDEDDVQGAVPADLGFDDFLASVTAEEFDYGVPLDQTFD